MHDEIVALQKAAGTTTVVANTKGPATGQKETEGMGDGWQTTSKAGKTIRPSVAVGKGFDESPISLGFRGSSHSSIKVLGHPCPPPTEQPFFTLQLEMGMPFVSTIDDIIKQLSREEALDDYKLKDGRVVTVSFSYFTTVEKTDIFLFST